jgi:anti-sigma regulatory factor (Ser/Thr protein kinase)
VPSLRAAPRAPATHHRTRLVAPVGGRGNEVKEMRASIVLAPEARSLAAGRAFVASMLEVWDCEDPDQVAALLTSEIVSNAVRHAASTVGLEVAIVGRRLRVEARDEAPNATVAPDPARPGGESGHGLHIVESLAQRWGVDRYEDHKVVWFETTVQPRRPNLD